LSRRPLRAPKL